MLTCDFCKIACWDSNMHVGICNMHVETQHLFLMMEALHTRQVRSNCADRRAWGAGNSLSLGIGERARSIGNRRCDELLATLIARAVSSLSAEHRPPPQQPRYGPDGDRRKNPERATRRPTSPSDHACPTPHYWKTPRRPASHAFAQPTSTCVRVAATGDPTNARRPPASPGTASMHPCWCP
jgi:hypothetical protein